MSPLMYVLDCSLCSPDGTRATKNYSADAGFRNFVTENELNKNSVSFTKFQIFLLNIKLKSSKTTIMAAVLPRFARSSLDTPQGASPVKPAPLLFFAFTQ